MFKARQAKRTRRPLKVSMEGLSGGGKSYTALRLAFDMRRHGMGKRIVVIDSENESAGLYAGQMVEGERWDFMTVDMPADKRNPAGYAEAYEWAVGEGYDIIIFDSLSHAWHGALEQVDQMSRGGDKMRAWANMSPQQRQMIQTLTDPRAHCIVTMRVKTDFQEVEGGNGKKRMQKVGMKADQRDNTEYEFDMVLRFEAGNECHVEKVRGCSAMNGKSATKPGPAFWKPLFDWWLEGDAAQPAPSIEVKPAPVEPPVVDVDALLSGVTDAATADERKTIMAAIGEGAKRGAFTEDQLKRFRTAALVSEVKLAAGVDELAKAGEAIDKAETDGRITGPQSEVARKKVTERMTTMGQSA